MRSTNTYEFTNGAVYVQVVVPPNPGTDGCVGLRLADGDRYSVAFGPTSAITNDGTLSFSAKKPLAEGVCGRVP